mmetsp:Transcript_70916/g.189217  ORF Transcript_70916/g.189217 Transcript_70916/m.189217 type:complete len:215 (+) Transcript_70916:1748-2392(+)
MFRCVKLLKNTSCCTTSSVIARRQQETSHLIRLVAALMTCSTACRVSCEQRETDNSRNPMRPDGGLVKGLGSNAASDTLVHPSIRSTCNLLQECSGNCTIELVTCLQLLKSSSIRFGQLYPILLNTDRRSIVAPSNSNCWRSSVRAILTTWSFTEFRDTKICSNLVKLCALRCVRREYCTLLSTTASASFTKHRSLSDRPTTGGMSNTKRREGP